MRYPKIKENSKNSKRCWIVLITKIFCKCPQYHATLFSVGSVHARKTYPEAYLMFRHIVWVIHNVINGTNVLNWKHQTKMILNQDNLPYQQTMNPMKKYMLRYIKIVALVSIKVLKL